MPGIDLFDPEAAPRGVATLIKTPLLENGRLDEESFARQVQYVVDVGACLTIPGMHGAETYSLSDAERARCLEITMDICGDRVPVCATVVGLSLRDAIAAARRAEEMGGDVVAVVTPPWVKGERDAVEFIRAVADATTVPSLAHTFSGGGPLSPAAVARMAVDSPSIRYLKEEAPWCGRRLEEMFAVPGGDLFMGIVVTSPSVLAYQAGGTMFMASADIQEPLQAVFDALEAGDVRRAREIDHHLGALQHFRAYISGQLNNKMIMHRQGLFASRRIADPSSHIGLSDLNQDEEDQLTFVLEPLLPCYTKNPPLPPT